MTLLGINSARRICSSPLFAESITLTQAGLGAYDDTGVWNEAASTTYTLNASVQPATPRQRETLPEAFRMVDAMIFFIATTNTNFIRPVRFGTAASDPDEILYKGIVWIVASILEDFSSHGHIGVVAYRKDDQDG